MNDQSGSSSSSGSGSSGSSSSGSIGGLNGTNSQPSMQGGLRQPFEASELQGKDVYDSAGKKVGSIDAVVPSTGPTRDVVLSVGGILGIGSKKVLVPATDIDRGNADRLVVSMTQDQLDKLPAYEAPKAAKNSSTTSPSR
jgi:sporulation protein YlmC with PRC-barrel domain